MVAAVRQPMAPDLKILTVIGNRPQFVKAAAVSHRLRQRAREILVHTGQHYDHELSQCSSKSSDSRSLSTASTSAADPTRPRRLAC